MGINFSEVAFTYNPKNKVSQNKYILEKVNLTIQKNDEFICLVGHTGSGKSTLVQMMNGLLIPTIGEVVIDDKIIRNKKKINLKEVRKKIGLVFQFPEYQLFEETVLKDVCFGPKNFNLDNIEERAKKALEFFKLNDSYYNKDPFKLSGGEMRKVAISGILASDPDVLILDEPTVGLDPHTKMELIKLLKSLNEEEHKTIIIITHDMNVVWKLAKRVLVVDENKIVYDGSKKDLFMNEDLVYQHNLDLPDILKVGKGLKEKLKIDIDIYRNTIEELYDEISRYYNE